MECKGGKELEHGHTTVRALTFMTSVTEQLFCVRLTCGSDRAEKRGRPVTRVIYLVQELVGLGWLYSSLSVLHNI